MNTILGGLIHRSLLRLFPLFRLTGLIMVALFAFQLRAENASAFAKLTIQNLPGNGKVTINNALAHARENGVFEAPSGPTAIQIELGGVEAYSASFTLAPGEDKTIILDCQQRCATLDIVTDPFGASVYVNATFVGLTPYVNGFMRPGRYDLDVSMPGYQPASRTINLEKAKPAMITINLDHTQAFNDSIKAVKKARKKSRQFAQKLVFGGCALACAAGGVFFDMNARTKLSQADNAAVAYDGASGDFQKYHNDYTANRDGARKSLGARDLLYGAASVCALGFTFSFFF
jgi:hypothetical protein